MIVELHMVRTPTHTLTAGGRLSPRIVQEAGAYTGRNLNLFARCNRKSLLMWNFSGFSSIGLRTYSCFTVHVYLILTPWFCKLFTVNEEVAYQIACERGGPIAGFIDGFASRREQAHILARVLFVKREAYELHRPRSD